MDLNESSVDSNWASTPVKQEKNNNINKKTATRPKENRNFCEKWLSLFSPWLTRCEGDPNRPFCRACQRPLDNNRFRLQRHERTAKHSRNQEILLNEGEDVVRLILSRCRQRKRNLKNEIHGKSFPSNAENALDTETPFKDFKYANKATKVNERNECKSFTPTKRENHSMGEYYYSPPHQYSRPHPASMQHKKDSFDMFFEAISASVKNLPPKLAAEVKSRISQVIAEFELRAICEKEAEEKAKQSVIKLPGQVTNFVTIDAEINTDGQNTNLENPSSTVSNAAVTEYVYSYKQKSNSEE